MIVHYVEQGSAEWLALRLGVPTASEFEKIITPATGKLSAASHAYAVRLVTERLLNRSLDDVSNLQWVERGKELEPAAVRLFEFQEGVKTKPVGFITTDDGMIGASPDRLVGDDGLLEIKCPAPHTHMGYLLDGFGTAYRPQVQGQLFVTGRQCCIRMSYHPEMPLVIERIERDEPYIAKLGEALAAFLDMRDEMLDRARSLGVFTAPVRPMTPAEVAYGDDGTANGRYVTILNPFGYPEDLASPLVSG